MPTADVSPVARLSFAEKAGLPLGSIVDRFIVTAELQDLYHRVVNQGTEDIWGRLLGELGVECFVAPEDLHRIPRSGPLMVVANHPFGIIEGALLGHLLSRVRADVKVLTNHLLSAVPELADRCFWVDPINPRRSPLLNRRGLKDALAWLKDGGTVVVFPSGEVSRWDFRRGKVLDPKWNAAAARLSRISDAHILPMFVRGGNSLPFHLLGMVHPRLRTVQLTRELMNKRGQKIEIVIGSRISPETMRRFEDSEKATRYIRWRTYLLSQRRVPASARITKSSQAIAPRSEAAQITEEISLLPAGQKLVDSREFAVYTAEAWQIPTALREVGRLRELTFRKVGEGSGKECDLDRFDSHYDHLLLWNRSNKEIAGAYRIARTDEILNKHGIAGLYTSTLFRFDAKFFQRVGPALELGRSFITPEYQRHHSSLLMLWKGIGAYVVRHPANPVLFGPVSISNNYAHASRDMVFRFFREQAQGELSRYVRPRRPFRSDKAYQWDFKLSEMLNDLELLSDPVADIEPDRKGIPILLKQYVRLGGVLLSFNVDREFSDVLDGLVLVDLRKTPRAHLDRYLGSCGASSFMRSHGLEPAN